MLIVLLLSITLVNTFATRLKHFQYILLTDRKTDRQTDRHKGIALPLLCMHAQGNKRCPILTLGMCCFARALWNK